MLLGAIYISCGRYNDALISFSRVLLANPRHVEALLNVAHSYQLEKNYRMSVRFLNTALSIDPLSPRGLQGRAVVQLMAGSYRESISDLTLAVAISQSAEIYVNRGVAYQAAGDIPRATMDFRRAISIDPSFALAYFNLGNLYLKFNQLEFAEECYSKSLNLKPNDSASSLNRAITRSLLGATELALEDYSTALKFAKKPFVVLLNRAKLFQKMNRHQEAQNDLDNALSLDLVQGAIIEQLKD